MNGDNPITMLANILLTSAISELSGKIIIFNKTSN